jgi:hypothetical protein
MAKKKNPHAVALGRRGGLVKSIRKRLAVIENGKKGGRPPKQPDSDAA